MKNLNRKADQWALGLFILLLSREGDGVSDWRSDLLTTLIQDSWLHLITAPSLIFTICRSIQHTLSLCRLLRHHQSFPGNGFVSGNSSTALNKSSLHRLPLPLRRTSRPVSVITSRHGPRRKHSSLLYSNRFRGNVFVCEGVTQ
jgi:hypothetical protein